MNYVISLGGSIINPGKVDLAFLDEFAALINQRTKKGDKFFIITGGGALARQYQDVAKKLGRATDRDLDLLGIAATHINAELLQSLLGRQAQVLGGTKPGWSTDYVAVKKAIEQKVKTVINLSNIDYVYDKDPNKYKNARKLEKISWNELLKLTGSKWRPGANLPFDPVAARLAKNKKLRVAVLNGRKLKNFEAFLKGKKFKGTVIE